MARFVIEESCLWDVTVDIEDNWRLGSIGKDHSMQAQLTSQISGYLRGSHCWVSVSGDLYLWFMANRLPFVGTQYHRPNRRRNQAMLISFLLAWSRFKQTYFDHHQHQETFWNDTRQLLGVLFPYRWVYDLSEIKFGRGGWIDILLCVYCIGCAYASIGDTDWR